MKRIFPPLFLGCALLANLAMRILYAQYLETWTPAIRYSSPQPLGFFALLGVPAGIILLWAMWKPSPARLAGLSAARRWSGNILLAATILLWLRYVHFGLYAGWVAATPVDDPLAWLRQSHKMFNYAFVTLPLGGILALWLKGICIPPRIRTEVK